MNRKRKDWPNFSYDAQVLAELENRLLRESGTLLGAFKHLNREQQQSITIDLISDEAPKTSEIESEYFDRGSLQSSNREQFVNQRQSFNSINGTNKALWSHGTPH